MIGHHLHPGMVHDPRVGLHFADDSQPEPTTLFGGRTM